MKNEEKVYDICGMRIRFDHALYMSNGADAVMATAVEGDEEEPYSDVSVNVPGTVLCGTADEVAFVLSHDCPAELYSAMSKKKLVRKAGFTVRYGFCEQPVVYMKRSALTEGE